MQQSEQSPSAHRAAISLATPAPRLRQLLADHQRILKRLASKRKELGRFEDELRRLAGELVAVVEPLMEELNKLDDAIHIEFETILSSCRRASTRRDVRALYLELQEDGVISPRGRGLENLHDDGIPDFVSQRERQEYDAQEFGNDAGQDDAFVAGGEHKGRDRLSDLRATFLRLADRLHPDKVQDDSEKEIRTEAMKELNRAYRDGDVARLLELDKTWGEGASKTVSTDLEGTCESLERQNRLLLEQHAAVQRELTELRRSHEGGMVVEIRRLRRERDPNPIATLTDPLRVGVEQVRGIHGFVQAFRQGRISLKTFLAGPDFISDEDDWFEDEDLDGEIFEVFATELARQFARMESELHAPSKKTKSGKRRGRSRAKRR